ncbi:MAG: HAD family phosphatase [Bacilli bacterium]|nr:HAD family phosphatase [Bacilli bacterium]
MRNKLKIFFIDIDWTILDHNKHDWDYESIKALKEAQKAGILVYLNTARPYDSIVHTGIFDVFKPDGVVCTNGGVVFCGDKLLYANVIPEDMVRQVEKVANKHHLVLELASTKERYFTAKANTYVHKYFSVFVEVIPDIRKYQNKDISQILLFAPEKYDEVLAKEFPKEVKLFRFDTHGVDVGYFNNEKGTAVKKVLKHLNISKDEAVSAGDSFDDVSMFNETGISIAMGNGTDFAKEHASIIAPPIGEHGLAKIIKQLIE